MAPVLASVHWLSKREVSESVHTLAKRIDNVHTLVKRIDNIGGIPLWILVILIMLGAGALVVVIYGLARFMSPVADVIKPISAEQSDYMREVRARNLDTLAANFGGRGYRYRQSGGQSSVASHS